MSDWSLANFVSWMRQMVRAGCPRAPGTTLSSAPPPLRSWGKICHVSYLGIWNEHGASSSITQMCIWPRSDGPEGFPLYDLSLGLSYPYARSILRSMLGTTVASSVGTLAWISSTFLIGMLAALNIQVVTPRRHTHTLRRSVFALRSLELEILSS